MVRATGSLAIDSYIFVDSIFLLESSGVCLVFVRSVLGHCESRCAVFVLSCRILLGNQYTNAVMAEFSHVDPRHKSFLGCAKHLDVKPRIPTTVRILHYSPLGMHRLLSDSSKRPVVKRIRQSYLQDVSARAGYVSARYHEIFYERIPQPLLISHARRSMQAARAA